VLLPGDVPFEQHDAAPGVGLESLREGCSDDGARREPAPSVVVDSFRKFGADQHHRLFKPYGGVGVRVVPLGVQSTNALAQLSCYAVGRRDIRRETGNPVVHSIDFLDQVVVDPIIQLFEIFFGNG
jgi:hypothetical protein